MSEITMYGAEWCGDCRRSKKFLDANNVKYNYVDVEADASASDKVIEINGVLASCNVSTAIAEKVVKPPSTPVTTKWRRVSLFIMFGELAINPISNAPITLTIKVDHGNEVSLVV